MSRNTIRCPECDGSAITFREEILTDCDRCLGRGWVSMPGELFRPQTLGVGAFLLGFALAFVVLVGTGLA